MPLKLNVAQSGNTIYRKKLPSHAQSTLQHMLRIIVISIKRILIDEILDDTQYKGIKLDIKSIDVLERALQIVKSREHKVSLNSKL